MSVQVCRDCGSKGPFGELRNPRAKAAVPKKMTPKQIVLMCLHCQRIFAGYPADNVAPLD